MTKHSFDTQLIHAGEPSPRIHGAVAMPVFQSATFEYDGGPAEELRYIRLNNTPNHVALHQKLAAITGGQDAVVTASGMAAITTTLFALLKPGDHVIAQRSLYGGAHALFQTLLPGWGVETDFVDPQSADSWAPLVRARTRLMYVESISNPLIEVVDLEGVVKFSRKHNLISIIDNTFATPVNYRPLQHGFDISIHSCTKYLNGHSDLVAGAVIGGKDHLALIKEKLIHFGGALDPHAAFLLHRSLKTLGLRVRAQNHNALRIASALQAHPRVERVRYPGLPTHPQHQRAKALFDGFGGMLSFELRGGLAAAERLFADTRLVVKAPSLGGVETLMSQPIKTSHAGLTAEERAQQGIGEGLVRLSVGIEDPDDIVADLERALDSI